MQRRKVLLCLGLAGLLGVSPLYTLAEEINVGQAMAAETMEGTDEAVDIGMIGAEESEAEKMIGEPPVFGELGMDESEEDLMETEGSKEEVVEETVDSKTDETEEREIETEGTKEIETDLPESETAVIEVAEKEAAEKANMLTENIPVEMSDEDEVDINEENFPSEKFRAYVSEQFDKDHNRKLSVSERESVEEIWLQQSAFCGNLDGIEYFPKLTKLTCRYCDLTSLDVSRNLALEYLDCTGNQLTSLDVSQNLELTRLECLVNQLTSLDISHNLALYFLSCSANSLTSLDISQNQALTYLNCSGNQLSLDVSQNPMLRYLECRYAELTNLDVSQNPELTHLYCDNNQLTSLDISQNSVLAYLHCNDNQLMSLDGSHNPALKVLYCDRNQLTSLNVKQNPELAELYCTNNKLMSLDVSHNPALEKLFCQSNQLACLDLSQNPVLKGSVCDGQKIVIKGNKINMAEYDSGFDGSRVADLDGLSLSGGTFTLEDGKDSGHYAYDTYCFSADVPVVSIKVTIMGDSTTGSEDNNGGGNDNGNSSGEGDNNESGSVGGNNNGSGSGGGNNNGSSSIVENNSNNRSHKENTKAEVEQPDTSAGTVKEIVGNRVKFSNGNIVTSTIGGIYNAGSVAGAAVITPKENVCSAAGLSASDIRSGTNISFYVCDCRIKGRNAALKAIADGIGKKEVAYINLDMYSITRKGVISTIRTTSEPITIVFGIPARFVNPANTYSIICIDESGKTVMFSDMDTDDNTITIQTNVFGTYMIVY